LIRYHEAKKKQQKLFKDCIKLGSICL